MAGIAASAWLVQPGAYYGWQAGFCEAFNSEGE